MNHAAVHKKSASRVKPVFTRRRFMNACWGAVAAGVGTYVYGAHIEAHRLVVEQVTIQIPDLAARWHGKRLVQLSDFHAGRTSIAHIQRSLEIALDLKPEFLLLTGDQVDNAVQDIDPLCRVLKRATARVPTLACTGNHDFAPAMPNFADKVCSDLTNAGVRMLRNDIYQPERGPGELCFAGIEDLWRGTPDPSILRRAPTDSSVIVLCHNPDGYQSIADYRWHLTLSGHTHGGQVRVPFYGPISVPVQHREFAAGLFFPDPAKRHRALYVSRGVGHFVQFRLFCAPEVTCITLKNPAM